MIKTLFFAFVAMTVGFSAGAEEPFDMDRDPANVIVPTAGVRRAYPGSDYQEDLRVLTVLPEAALRTDTRGIQKEVFKTLYNRELKDESTTPVEE